MNTQLKKIRSNAKRRYDIISSLKKKLEFDHVERNAYRITRFLIKNLNKDPLNLSDLVDIPSKYRVKFYGYCNPLAKITMDICDEQINNLMMLGITDKKFVSDQIDEFKHKAHFDIFKSKETQCHLLVMNIKDLHAKFNCHNMIYINSLHTYFIVKQCTMDILKRKKHAIR
mgnify:CR=1 FL=1